MSDPRKPYVRECNICQSHDIRTMWKTPNDVDYEYCADCKERKKKVGGFLIGPGIRELMSSKERMTIYNRYFGNCCTVCGIEQDLKVCGYTNKGRGIPFRLCPKCRHPNDVSIHKIRFEVKPMDEDWFNRALIEKQRVAAVAQKKVNIKKMGVKRPDMNRQTGKTARNRERKARRKV